MTQQQGDRLAVEHLCALAQVSRAGFYRHWREMAPREEETELRSLLQDLALAHRHYGYRRLGVLLRKAGHEINHKRVLRLMRQDNLLCLRKRKFAPATTNSRHGWRVYPNLARWLVPTKLNQLWVADITYIRLRQSFAYLAVILDAFSRRVIGWSMADHLEKSLTLDALQMALDTRGVQPGDLIHHSDRGVQYACGTYIEQLEQHGIQPSMSRAGCPTDNAKAESFMRTLKQEEVDGRRYANLVEARNSIEAFLSDVYNRQRLHSALAYQSPDEYEANIVRQAAAAQQPLVELNPGCV